MLMAEHKEYQQALKASVKAAHDPTASMAEMAPPMLAKGASKAPSRATTHMEVDRQAELARGMRQRSELALTMMRIGAKNTVTSPVARTAPTTTRFPEAGERKRSIPMAPMEPFAEAPE